MLRTLYKQDERYRQTYFGRFENQRCLGRFEERTYFVGDAARIDDDGYIWVSRRIDDVMDIAGHRLSATEVQSATVSHRKVAAAAAIGQSSEASGHAICAFVVLRESLLGSAALELEIEDRVMQRLSDRAWPSRVIWTTGLPKTRSGKIMRRLLRDIAEGRELGDVTALRDPDVMDELEQTFSEQPDDARGK